MGQVASRWGFSPFALVLRLYQGIGSLASAASALPRTNARPACPLGRGRRGARTWQRHRRDRQSQRLPDQAAVDGFDATQLHRAAIVLEGYAAEAGLPKSLTSPATLEAEAEAASVNFAVRLSRDLDALIARQAQRHTGWFTRGHYEILLLAMLGFLLFRLGKNFFYDSWRSDVPLPMWGLESYLASAFWLGLWCFLLLWMFMRRLRGGLKQAVDRLAENWIGSAPLPAFSRNWKTSVSGPRSSAATWNCFKVMWNA